MAQTRQDMGSGNVKKLLLQLMIPAIVAQVVNLLYNIVDRIYISNIPLVGETALAGVGVCGPVVTLIGAFASLIGVGGAPLMSIRMGAGKTEEARRILSNSFLMLCVCSVVLMAGVFPLRQRMLMAFGASNATYGYANTYFTVYLCGTVFSRLRGGPHHLEQAVRGLQRHRQQTAVAQPAARRVSGHPPAGQQRHGGAGTAILPLPPERL